jgi:N-acetylglucosamine kinase-like BadF-type ATPase
MRCVIGVDSGGSKCEVAVARDDGEVLGWGRQDPPAAGPLQGVSVAGNGRTEAAISRAVQSAMAGVQCDEVHVAGPLARNFDAVFSRHCRARLVLHHAVSEHEAALRLAGERFGVVALAGTGAFVFGSTRDGRTLILDGCGPLLGDRGSGFQIGLHALRAAARATWHPRHGTSLTRVLELFHAHGPGDPHNPAAYMAKEYDRSEIARLATTVNEAADSGDRVAKSILCRAAGELAASAYDVADRLGMRSDEYPLVGTGGVISHSRIFWDHFCRMVRRFAPKWRLLRSDMPPVLGHVLAAAQRLPEIDQEAFRARLLESAGARIPKAKGGST